MANTFSLKSASYDGRYMKADFKQKSNGSDKNSSTIEWTLSTIGGQYWYDTGPTALVINGTTVCSIEFKSWEYGQFPVAIGSTSGSIVIPHNNDGTKKITVKLSTAIYYHAVQEYSDEWTLDSIPRYATVAHSLNAKTETTIKMNWSSDSVINHIWYSTNNGSTWAGVNVEDGKSGTYTIGGLSANTEYKIKTRVQRKDSELTTESSALSVTTYDYPHCTSAPDFVIGQAVTLKFYNPLKRTFNFSIVGNGSLIHTWTLSGKVEYIGVNGEPAYTNLYASIPESKSAKYIVNVDYGTSTKTTQGGTYSINESKCAPTFAGFTYEDSTAITKYVSENPQVLIKGQSNLRVVIAEENKMITKNGARPSHYVITIDTLSKTTVYYDEDITADMGVVSSAGTKRLTVRAYDSRGVSTPVYKDVVVYDYEKPVINASATRLNNFEAQTTLKISGEYSRLTIGGADKNTINNVQYRQRETNGTWSNWVTISATKTAGKFTCSNITLSFDITKSYEIEISASDKLKSNTIPVHVDIGQAVFFVSSNKKNAYLNGEEVATKNFVGDAITALFPAGSSVTNALYPVGAVMCMSTNKNPSSIYGGTWTLIDKGFKSYSAFTPSIFTAGANVVADTVYLSRGANTIRIRLSIVINSAISDTGMSLGTLKWADVGITGLHAGIIEQLAYRDGANGGIVYSIFHESGEIQLVDVFDQSSIATGNTFYLDFTFVSDYTRMLDSVCDKFYWKRTA